MIRLGLLTPFDNVAGFEAKMTTASTSAGAAASAPRRQQQPAAAAAGRSAAADAVDEQWALLQQRAAPAAASEAVRASDVGDLAHQLGRGGLPLSELMAKATQQTLEQAVVNRPRTVLMEPDQVRR